MLILPLTLMLQLSSSERIVTADQEAVWLSARLAKHVSVAKNLKSEILFICNRDAPAEVEVEAVASCLNATASTSGENIYIERLPAQRKNISSVRASERAKWILKMLDERRIQRLRILAGRTADQALSENIEQILSKYRLPLSQPEIIQGSKSLNDFANILPAQLLLDRIIEKITPQKLANIPSGDLVIYETDPIGPVEQLPDIGDLISGFEESMRRFESSIQMADIDKVSNLFGQSFLSDLRSVAVCSKVRLQAKASLTGVLLTLELYDTTGRKIAHAAMNAVRPSVNANYSKIEIDATQKGESVWIHFPSQLSDSAANRLQLGLSFDWYLHPEKTEPLGLFALPAIERLASDSSANCVVFDLPDASFGDALTCVDGVRFNLSKFRRLLKDAECIETVRVGKTYVFRSTDPEWVERSRSDRKALARFARIVEQSGYIDPREEAKLYYRCKGLYIDWRTIGQSCLSSKNSSTPIQGTLKSLISVIGAISDSDWQFLQSNRTLTARELGITTELVNVLSMAPDIQGEQPLSDLARHPLEMYTDRRVSDTPISLTGTDTEIARISASGKSFGWVRLSDLPSEMMHYPLGLAKIRNKTRETLDSFLQTNCRFAMARQNTTIFVVGLPFGHSIEQSLKYPLESPIENLEYDRMPQSFRDKVWNCFSRAFKLSAD